MATLKGVCGVLEPGCSLMLQRSPLPCVYNSRVFTRAQCESRSLQPARQCFTLDFGKSSDRSDGTLEPNMAAHVSKNHILLAFQRNTDCLIVVDLRTEYLGIIEILKTNV